MGRRSAKTLVLATLHLVCITGTSSALPSGRAWAPAETLRVAGYEYLGAPQLDARGDRPRLIGVAQQPGTGGASAMGFYWSDQEWVAHWNLGRGTSFLPPVPSTTQDEFLVWREVTLESHFIFSRLTEFGPADPETIATIGTGTNLYAAAASSSRRWAIAPDFKNVRAFVSATAGLWRELETGFGGRFAAAIAAINETTAVAAWEEIDGMHWAIVTDSAFVHQGIVAGPPAPKVPQLRARPSGGYWMTWGSFDPSLSIASYRSGAWTDHALIPCAYSVATQHFSENSDMSRDDGEYPVVAWTAQRMGRTAICVCVPTDSGFTTAEELTFAPDGVLPSVARDRNGDAWVAWWKFFDGIFWTHTYVTATAHSVAAQGTPAARTVSWTLSEPAPETWWAVLRAPPGGDFVEAARVRATPSLGLDWIDASPADGPLRYRVRRESVDRRYEWLSNEVLWDDGVVSTTLSLLSAEATPDRATLIWQGSGAETLDATVERRMESSDWQEIGTAMVEGADRLRFEDSTVIPGGRYGYRLSFVEDGNPRFTATAWVDVPRRPSLELQGFRPNPSRGQAVIAFTLPSASTGTLDVYDVSGRRVFQSGLSGRPGGSHVMQIGGDRPLAPGVYVIRLRHSGREVSARGVIVE